MTHAMGVAIDTPDMKYVPLRYEEARNAMLSIGQSASFVEGLLRIARNLNEGRARAKERTVLTDIPTIVDQFAADVFRPEFERALQGIAH